MRFQLCRAASHLVPFVRSMNLGRGGQAEPAGDAQHWGTIPAMGQPFEGTLVMSCAAMGAATSSLPPPRSLTRGNVLARHNSAEKFMAHQRAMGQGCSLRECLQGFLPAESGFDVAHAALPCRTLPPAPSLSFVRLRHSSPQPTVLFLPSGFCGSTTLAGSSKCAQSGGQHCQLPPCMLPCRAAAQGGFVLLPNPPQPVSALGGQDPSGEERG